MPSISSSQALGSAQAIGDRLAEAQTLPCWAPPSGVGPVGGLPAIAGCGRSLFEALD